MSDPQRGVGRAIELVRINIIVNYILSPGGSYFPNPPLNLSCLLCQFFYNAININIPVAVFLHMMRCVDNGAYAADLFSSRVGKSRGGCERLSLGVLFSRVGL